VHSLLATNFPIATVSQIVLLLSQLVLTVASVCVSWMRVHGVSVCSMQWNCLTGINRNIAPVHIP
jgi:hypothetical protein